MVKSPPPSTEPSWATREAKRKDRPLKKDSPWKRKLKSERRAYDADPEAYIEDISIREDDFRKTIRLLANADIIKEAGNCDDPELRKMQRMINRMAKACGKFPQSPKLFIHPDGLLDDTSADSQQWDAAARLPDYIEVNESTAAYLLKHTDQFKAVLAHEMGHIANGDFSVEKKLNTRLAPPNQLKEVLADRMGAIVHGNPSLYAKSLGNFLLHVVKCEGVKTHLSSQEYSSTNGRIRMLTKWADILKREHATDEKGNVILDKALEVYKRSEEFATDLLQTDKGYQNRLRSLPDRFQWDGSSR